MNTTVLYIWLIILGTILWIWGGNQNIAIFIGGMLIGIAVRNLIADWITKR